MDEIEKVGLSRSDREKLYELIFVIPEQVVQGFEQNYRAWKETWSDPKLQIHSNPRMFAQSKEYDRFLSYCQEKGKSVWPLIFSKYEQGDHLVINVIEDLTFPEYSGLMDQIMIENLKRAPAVVPSQTANWTEYTINVLSELYDDYREEQRRREEGKRGTGQ